MAAKTGAWNYGDILDTTAAAIKIDRPAFIHGDRTIMWSEMDKRTNRMARRFIDAGLKPGDRVAFYHRNGIEYGELLVACFKARLTHVNINFRYKDAELLYILKDSGAKVVSFDPEFDEVIGRIRNDADDVSIWLRAGNAPSNNYDSYEDFASDGDGAPLDIERSGEDTLMIYTGGTTGMPKGVIWAHDPMRKGQINALAAIGPAPDTYQKHNEFVSTNTDIKPFMPACPWMHGTGLTVALAQVCFGYPIVTVDSRDGLNAEGIWRETAKHKVHQMAIVGDAFAKPMLSALTEMSDDLDLSRFTIMVSSGAMWSREVKAALLERLPQLIMADMFGASETLAFGATFSTKENIVDTAKIMLMPNAKIMKEDGVFAGPGETGQIAIKGLIGEGYFGDEEKTANTYRTIDGERWCIPGDFARVDEDGLVTLLGRGSNCINTGGEKVYPEEVEEVLKIADGVKDALVVGVPDEKWGNAIVAVVTPSDGSAVLDAETLREFVAGRLARYKAPKQVIFTQNILRGPNGKADYKAARAAADAALA
ncbi:MAG: AMP-binding protein [Pseudomonadota bacterium]